LPPVYEVSIASTDDASILETELRTSTETITKAPLPVIRKEEFGDMPIARCNSSCDRLGLGGRIRKNDVLPWDNLEPLDKSRSRRSLFFKTWGWSVERMGQHTQIRELMTPVGDHVGRVLMDFADLSSNVLLVFVTHKDLASASQFLFCFDFMFYFHIPV
jgi:hypothetical protein